MDRFLEPTIGQDRLTERETRRWEMVERRCRPIRESRDAARIATWSILSAVAAACDRAGASLAPTDVLTAYEQIGEILGELTHEATTQIEEEQQS